MIRTDQGHYKVVVGEVIRTPEGLSRDEAVNRMTEGSNRWAGRPFASWLLRVAIVGVPVAASFATAWVLTSVTSVPSTILGAVVRWVLVAVAATVVMVATPIVLPSLCRNSQDRSDCKNQRFYCHRRFHGDSPYLF